MSVFKRGETYWFKFLFQGQLIRESAKTNSKTVAREAERARRRDLELGVNRIGKRERTPLFPTAAKEWIEGKVGKSQNTFRNYRQYVDSLTSEFKDRLVCDIDISDIRTLQRKRLKQGLGHRSVNYEIRVLRQILKTFRLWHSLSEDVDWLREKHDVGKALVYEDEEKLYAACAASRSPALLPLFVLCLDAGLRATEAKTLRRCDLKLEWQDRVIARGELVVAKSKTEAGAGRKIPLTRRACSVLTLWLSRFPAADQEAFVFPSHQVGFAGDGRGPLIYAVDFGKPMSEWKSAWYKALRQARLKYRWHDLTFITRLLENPNNSEETVRALAGHVSRKMMEHYSHIRQKAKEAAIAGLETPDLTADISAGWAQNWAQSKRNQGGEAEKVLDFSGATRRIRTDDLLITNQLLYQLS
jgi:integrase